MSRQEDKDKTCNSEGIILENTIENVENKYFLSNAQNIIRQTDRQDNTQPRNEVVEPDEEENEATLSITGSESKRSQERSSYWSVTWNNPGEKGLQYWKELPHQYSFVKEVQGQLEEAPTTGTPHIQGLLKTSQVRFSAVKRILPLAHIEKAKKPSALRNYVSKPETRIATIQGVVRQDDKSPQEEFQRSLYLYVKSLIKDKNATYDAAYKVIRLMPNPGSQVKELLDNHEMQEWLKAHAKEILDKVVGECIRKRQFTTAFVLANNQVRSCYQRNIVDWLYINAEKDEEDDSETEGGA